MPFLCSKTLSAPANTTYNTAALTNAPTICTTMYGTTRRAGKPPHTAIASVTAGLRCAPESDPVR